VSAGDTTRAAQLYNSRFEQFGRDIRTVGWGSEADQRLRFEVLLRGFDPAGKTVLDVGCGLGALVPFLQERCGDFRYLGIDVAERLVADARAAHGGPGREFLVGDLFSLELPPADLVLLSGALSLKSEGIEDYARRTLERMFGLAREAACLNFLSKYVDYELEKNQHYQPETVFGWAKQVARKVNLIHDYPLYEFTIQLVR
jgi:SAM-dependent methyltransferase